MARKTTSKTSSRTTTKLGKSVAGARRAITSGVRKATTKARSMANPVTAGGRKSGRATAMMSKRSVAPTSARRNTMSGARARRAA